MSKRPSSKALPEDRDEAPALDEHFFATGALKSGDVTLREATDTIARRGRPPLGRAAKVQQSLRLSREVIDHFRSTGPGWQARIDDTLRRVAEIQKAFLHPGDGQASTPAERRLRSDLKRANELIAGSSMLPDAGHSASAGPKTGRLREPKPARSGRMARSGPASRK